MNATSSVSAHIVKGMELNMPPTGPPSRYGSGRSTMGSASSSPSVNRRTALRGE